MYTYRITLEDGTTREFVSKKSPEVEKVYSFRMLFRLVDSHGMLCETEQRCVKLEMLFNDRKWIVVADDTTEIEE